MKKSNTNDKFSSVIALICVISLITVSTCVYLTLGHLRPEVTENVEGVFSFLYAEPTTEPEPEDETVRLMCAGDNIIHSQIYEAAAERKNGEGYDFSPVYKDIKDIIAKSDIAAVNQQTLISASLTPSSYPAFSSPSQVGDTLAKLGFDVVNHGNRSIGDKGAEGAEDTISYWEGKDVTLTGLYKSPAAAQTVPVIEEKGIRFSFLGVTEHINSPLGEGEPYVICLNPEDKTTAEVYNELKTLMKTASDTSDITVVYVNFDENGKSEPTTSQKDIINYLVSFGADVIIGCGTGAVQPVEIRENPDGSKAVIAYSVGNLVSAQNAKENMMGAIADIIFRKDAETGEITTESVKLIPLVTYMEAGSTNIRVIPLSELTEEMGQKHGIYGFTLEFAEAWFKETVGEANLEKYVLDYGTSSPDEAAAKTE